LFLLIFQIQQKRTKTVFFLFVSVMLIPPIQDALPSLSVLIVTVYEPCYTEFTSLSSALHRDWTIAWTNFMTGYLKFLQVKSHTIKHLLWAFFRRTFNPCWYIKHAIVYVHWNGSICWGLKKTKCVFLSWVCLLLVWTSLLLYNNSRPILLFCNMFSLNTSSKYIVIICYNIFTSDKV